MRTKKVEKTIFLAEDGKEFLTEKDCLFYEEKVLKRLKNIKYFGIYHGADFTEGRGFFSYSLVAVDMEYCQKEWVEMYCQLRFGQKIDWMYGTPAQVWEISSIEEKDYFNRKPKNGERIFISRENLDGYPNSIIFSEKTKSIDDKGNIK